MYVCVYVMYFVYVCVYVMYFVYVCVCVFVFGVHLVICERWGLLRCLGMALPVHGTSIYSMMRTAPYPVLYMPSA